MLLVEQKAGLFDSVDQCARSVFIIWALVDVKDYFNKVTWSFRGSKKFNQRLRVSGLLRIMKTKLWQTRLTLSHTSSRRVLKFEKKEMNSYDF